MEDAKSESVQIDLNKLCRTCLSENGDLRSIFLPDNSTGETVIIADMLTEVANVQIATDDGLPVHICIHCTLQVGSAYSFRQLCQQSDISLRQYLGKPTGEKQRPKKEEQNNDLSEVLLDLDTSSSDSEEEDQYRDQPGASSATVGDGNEKSVAQQQLLKLARTLKNKKKNVKRIATQNGTGAAAAKKRFSSVCNVCKKKFMNVKAFRKHLRTHIEDRPFKCKQCNRTFLVENYLNNHMKSHLPDEMKPYECHICKRKFIHSAMLQKHLLRHTNERPFVCKICNKGCFAENSLLKHMKIHEKREGDLGLLKHICDYCRMEFPSAESLSVHIKQHSGAKPFVCNSCGKCFPQRFNLELHYRKHTGERPFSCEVCKKGYVSKASLKIHMRTHTNERPFTCEFCGKAFRQSGDLTSHKRLHGTDKPIECDICQKRFTTAMKLKYHKRNHTGERPYACKVCDRRFTVNTILIRHERTHSGERPYVCVTCGKAFSQTSTLNNHMKVHANAVKAEREKELKYCIEESNKYHHQQQQQQPPQPQQQQQQMQQQQIILDHTNRLLQDPMQSEPIRILQQQDEAVHEAARLLPDTGHLMTENRAMLPEDPRLVINVVEPTRLLVQDGGHSLLNIDNRLMPTPVSVPEGSRIMPSDKYLVYGSYIRGHP